MCPLKGGLNRYLVVLESEQFLPQPVSVLLGPLVCQEFLDRVAPLKELVSVSPDRVGRIGHLHCRGVSVLGSAMPHGHIIEVWGSTHLVFHASCAALTLVLAVSSLKGGNGGLDSPAMTWYCTAHDGD